MTETAAHPDRTLTAGLGVVVVTLIAGVLFDVLPHVALVLAAIPVMATTLFYPKRALILLLGVQISLEFTQLDLANFYLGPFRMRPDDLLYLWVLLLWALCLPDGRGRVKTGVTARFIVFFVAVCFISLFWGVASGNDIGTATFMFKTLPGYLSFFPAAWLMATDRDAADQIVKVIIAASVLAGINIALRGYFKVDEFVYERSTGLRVQARQAFAIAVGFMFLFTRQLVRRNRASLSLVLPAGVVMLVGLILSQTRSVWFGMLLGMASAFVLYTVSTGRDFWRVMKILVAIAVPGVLFFFLAGYLVQSAGFLEMQDIAARTGSETGSYFTDATFLARAVSWIEVLKAVSSPVGMLLGKGQGAEITCFRFDYMQKLSFSTVDNSYFQILLNAGIPGLLALVLLFAHGIAGSGTRAFRERDPERRSVLLGVFGSLIAMASGSFFMSAITNYRFTVLFGVLFAMMAVRPGQAVNGGDLPERG
ncbi:MAG: O-antigen ligase family protein [Candidatus Fermentibacteraceae bacterium]